MPAVYTAQFDNMLDLLLTHDKEVLVCGPTGLGGGVEEAAAPPAPEPEPIAAVAAPAACGATYDVDTLKAGCPAGIDPNAKHLALSDAEFEAVFKMGKEDFAALPKWKQTGAKKTAGLF